MKFMLIARLKDSFYALPPDEQKEIMGASAQYREKLIKEGKLKEIYSLGNMKGAMTVFDLDSSEDLVRIAESVTFPFVDAEITPLVDVDVVREAQGKSQPLEGELSPPTRPGVGQIGKTTRTAQGIRGRSVSPTRA